MPGLMSFLRAATVLLAAVVTCGAAPATQSPFQAGMAQGRLIAEWAEPGVCAIVLERGTCRDDVAAASAFGGSAAHPEYNAWLANGDPAKRPAKPPVFIPPDARWKSEPAGMWAYFSGINFIVQRYPDNATNTRIKSTVAALLRLHAGARPASANSPTPSLLVTLPRLTGPLGAARAGVNEATIEELLDNPLALTWPQSCAFVSAAIEGFQSSYAPAAHDEAQSLAATMCRQSTLDRSTLAALRPELGRLAASISSQPDDTRQAYVMGDLAAQTAYNALVLHDRTVDAQIHAAIQAQSVSPGLPPQILAALDAIAATPAGDWPALNAAATNAVDAILDATEDQSG